MAKLTRSEAGRLGAIKTKETYHAVEKAKRVEAYEANPTQCVNCGKANSYKDRSRKFCSSSCSATSNNKKRRNKVCKCCPNTVSPKRDYCSHECHREDVFNTVTVPLIEAGKVAERPTLKRYLRKRGHNGCAVCTLTEWMGKSLTLQLDHIDGDATNNFPVNLRLICPNCHSQTPSWAGRNRGFGRKSRGINRKD